MAYIHACYTLEWVGGIGPGAALPPKCKVFIYRLYERKLIFYLFFLVEHCLQIAKRLQFIAPALLFLHVAKRLGDSPLELL